MADKANGLSYTDLVAGAIIEQLKEGTAPWQVPWEASGQRQLPHNPTTDKDYRGMNALWLLMTQQARGWSDSRWMTYKQAAAIGGQVRKGEKGTAIQYWQWEGREAVRDEKGRPVKDAEGKSITRPVRYERPRVYTAALFNAGQIDGLPPAAERPQPNEWERHQAAEAVLTNSGAKIEHQFGDRAFYSPGRDNIVLPEQGQFPTPDRYYATALHELGHWTGHPSRLNRDLAHPFGSEGYAKEELRAEIASLMVGDRLGIGHDPGQHAAYVGSWIKALEDDPREIFRAAADAEKIADYVLAFQSKQELAQSGPLDVPVSVVLDDPAYDFSHYRAHYGGTLQEQIEFYGLKTVGDVVGEENTDFAAMYETAIERLSPVYGFEPDYDEHSNGYYERKGVATAFAEKGFALSQGQQAQASQLAPEGPRDGAETTITIQTPVLTDPSEVAMKTSPEPVYLAVPYAEKNEAKELGAKWDREAKSWYAPAGTDLAPLERWMPQQQATQASEVDPRQEFKDALKEAGLIVEGLPQMDGQLVRVKVDGDKGKERSGTYVGHLDGRPAGYINNFRSGYEGPWKATAAKAKALTGQERARMAAEAAANRAQREREREATHQSVAHVVREHWHEAKPATYPSDHPYLKRKDVPGYGVRVDQIGKLAVPPEAAKEDQQEFSRAGSLLVPLSDTEGQIWAVQSIDGSGFKSLPKGGRYSGLFHLIGDMRGDGAIIVGEGYATSADLHRETSLPVAVAFSSNNIEAVATAIHEKYPGRPIIVAGDNDHQKPLELDTQGRPKPNVGKEKAEAAAEAVGGYAMLPKFERGDKGTDWNDLRHEKGKDVFAAQVRAGLAAAQRHQLARDNGAARIGLVADQQQQPDRQQTRERPAIRVDEGLPPPKRARSR